MRNVTKSKFKLSVFQMKYKEYLCVHDCTMHYDINIHIYMCIYTLMSKQFLQLSKIRFYTFIKENLEFQHVPEFLKWDIYVLVFINLINTTLVSNHLGWYMYQIFTCKYLVLEVGFLLCQILDGDSLVVYQFYLLSALNNLKKKCKRKGFLLV